MFLLRIFGWVMGALSILSLIENLDLARLTGWLDQWIEAYSLFISRISNFLFGWIDFYWLEINENEGHVFVVMMILISSIGRSLLKVDEDVEMMLILISSGMVCCIIPSLIFPGIFGLILEVICAFVFVVFLFFEEFDEDVWLVFFQELAGIIGVILILIAVNYKLSI